MASLVFFLSATVLFSQSAVAFNCSIPPVYVDIHKRAVHGSGVFQYGSFIGVGTNAQNQSLWPSISQNHTSFASRDYCNNGTTLKNCADSTGGFFDQTESSSFQNTSSSFKSLDTNRNGSFTGTFGQDTVRLYTHYFETDGASQTLLENAEIEIAQHGDITPSILGMGLQSTVLQQLANQNMITGRTYSLYIGQGFDRAGGVVNGSNTFGGYDAGRFTGDVHQYPMVQSNANPMTVRIKDIIISETGSSNNSVSLFDTSKFPNMTSAPSPFDAQITTDQFPLSLPYDITQNFISHLGAQQDNTWGDNSLKLKNPFNGTLSIVLNDGFTITLPPEVLMNASNITPIQDRAKDSSAPFYMGAAFLSQIYLMADFDSLNFFLATAVQKNNAVMPTPFCPKSTPTAYVRPNVNAWVAQGLIGAVIGGILGGIGIGIVAYCFVVGMKQRRKERKEERELEKGRKEAKMAQFEVEETPEFDPPPKSATPFFWKKR